jgi:hypothetical protein
LYTTSHVHSECSPVLFGRSVSMHTELLRSLSSRIVSDCRRAPSRPPGKRCSMTLNPPGHTRGSRISCITFSGMTCRRNSQFSPAKDWSFRHPIAGNRLPHRHPKPHQLRAFMESSLVVRFRRALFYLTIVAERLRAPVGSPLCRRPAVQGRAPDRATRGGFAPRTPRISPRPTTAAASTHLNKSYPLTELTPTF